MTPGTAHVAVVIGGDSATRALLQYLLMHVGCTVHALPSAEALECSLPGANPTIILIVVEPAASDVNALYTVRRLGYRVPTLVLGPELSLEMRRRAFALGAVDVVNLPADTHALVARLKNAVSSGVPTVKGTESTHIRAGGLILETGARVLRGASGRTVRLTQRESALLGALMSTPGQPVGRQDLLDQIWGADYVGDGTALDVCMLRLRRKLSHLDNLRRFLHTVPRRGYLFDARTTARPILTVDHADGPRVLVIDDDPTIAAMVREALGDEGYHVVCSLGPEGLVLARQLHPVVILLDLMMPGMDGMEVQRHLKSNPRTARIPLIAMSAGSNLLTHAREIDVDDYLVKPFDLDELLLRIRRWARNDAAPGSMAPDGRYREIDHR